MFNFGNNNCVSFCCSVWKVALLSKELVQKWSERLTGIVHFSMSGDSIVCETA
eukprot:SAG31_NODE_2612_length_5380_cov_3.060405_1_plen_52_part_10